MMQEKSIFVGRGKRFGNILIEDTSISQVHCQITCNVDGSYTIKDENFSTNGTFVDGHRIEVMTVSHDTVVTLGKSFSCKVGDFFKEISVPSEEIFYITNLKGVKEGYERDCKRLNDNKDKVTILKVVLTVLASIVTIVLGLQDDSVVVTSSSIAVTVIMFVFMIFNNPRKRLERIENRFDSKYICPSCSSKLRGYPYENLVAMGECPFCHCRLKG